MKKTPLIILAAAAAVFTFSCKKHPEPVEKPTEKTLKASVLSADKTSVVLTEANASAVALKLSWTSGLEEGWRLHLLTRESNAWLFSVLKSGESVLSITLYGHLR